MNNVVENMEQECKNTRHSKSDRPILDYANNPKAIVSICKEDCDCVEFIPMSVWINQQNIITLSGKRRKALSFLKTGVRF